MASAPAIPTTPVARVIVGAAIIDETNRIYLMKSSGKFGDKWIIPGGKVDFGETLETALVREVLEETALKVSDIQFLGIRELVEPERHFVCLEYAMRASSKDKFVPNQEATEAAWFSVKELSTITIARLTLDLIEQRLIPLKLIA